MILHYKKITSYEEKQSIALLAVSDLTSTSIIPSQQKYQTSIKVSNQ